MILLSFIITSNQKKVSVHIGEDKYMNGLSKRCAQDETKISTHIQAMVAEYFKLVQLEQKAVESEDTQPVAAYVPTEEYDYE